MAPFIPLAKPGVPWQLQSAMHVLHLITAGADSKEKYGSDNFNYRG